MTFRKTGQGNRGRFTGLLLLAALLLIAFLPGCGAPGEVTPPPTPTPRRTSTPTPAPLPSPAPAPSPSPAPTPPPEVIVRILPERSVSKIGDESTFEIVVEPKQYGISSAEIYLSFDAGAVGVVDLQPGELLGPSPVIGARVIDNQAGKVTYTLARRGPTYSPTRAGALARIRVQLKGTAQQRQYSLVIERVGMADERFEDIKPLGSQGASIEVK